VQLPVLDPDDTVADARDRFHVVRDEEHREAGLASQVPDFLEAALLELEIADRENLVGKQDGRLHVDRHRERQPKVHPAREVHHRGIDEVLDVREVDDVLEAFGGNGTRNAVDGGVHENVLARGRFIVEAGAEFEQRHDASVTPNPAGSRCNDLGDDFQERRLTRPIAADHAKDRPALDLEGHVPERPDLLGAQQVARERN
jgi:hypothetical protein